MISTVKHSFFLYTKTNLPATFPNPEVERNSTVFLQSGLSYLAKLCYHCTNNFDKSKLSRTENERSLKA